MCEVNLRTTYTYYRVPEFAMRPSTTLFKPKYKGQPEHVLPYRKSRPAFRPYPKGGGVVCKLWADDVLVGEGVATCSMSDNFCYKVGRNIAYTRARHNMLTKRK